MRKKCNCKTAYAELKNSIYGTEIEDTNMKQVIGYIEGMLKWPEFQWKEECFADRNDI